MGYMLNGTWQSEETAAKSTDGKFIRPDSQFRQWVKADGSSDFTPDLGRYHLYVSLACPWSHRVLIVRKLKRLEQAIPLSIVDPVTSKQGWTFSDGPGCLPDTVSQAQYLHQLYSKSQADYSGRVTVPMLWDKRTGQIVNNESADLMRMLNAEFNDYGDTTVDLYPASRREAIGEINGVVYSKVSDGVYKCGFALNQEAYEAAFDELFLTLDLLEERLSRQRYLVGGRLTEADWRLFVTLVRFDVVYYSHFKCNLRRISDYPCLSNYLRELYQLPGVAETVDFDHIKRHYYLSHPRLSLADIIPHGPALNLTTSHNREKMSRTREKSSTGPLSS